MRPSRMILLVALLPGCSDKPAPPAAPPAPAVDSAQPVAEARGPVEAAAKVFLRSVGPGGTASPGLLTAEFKTVIAPPAFPRDEAQGYSDDRADSWLKALVPAAPAASATCPVATAEAGFAVATEGDGRTLLRLVKSRDGWLVDWCQNTAAAPRLPGSLPAADAGEAGAWFAAAAFVESIGHSQLPAAESLMTPVARGVLSPPLFDPDRAAGYNRGKLHLELQRLIPAGASVPRFNLEKTEAGYQGRGELTVGPATKPFRIGLVRGTRPGEWKVGDFEVK